MSFSFIFCLKGRNWKLYFEKHYSVYSITDRTILLLLSSYLKRGVYGYKVNL